MKQYVVSYYIDHKEHKFGLTFETAFGAIYTARSIFDRHGLATDVMNPETGEVIAIFDKRMKWISEEFMLECHMLAVEEMR